MLVWKVIAQGRKDYLKECFDNPGVQEQNMIYIAPDKVWINHIYVYG